MEKLFFGFTATFFAPKLQIEIGRVDRRRLPVGSGYRSARVDIADRQIRPVKNLFFIVENLLRNLFRFLDRDHIFKNNER